MIIYLLLIAGLAIVPSIFGIRSKRRAIMSIASQLKAVEDDVASLKSQPAVTAAPTGDGTTDLSGVHAEIDAIKAQLAELSAFVGSPSDLGPAPEPTPEVAAEPETTEPAPEPISPN